MKTILVLLLSLSCLVGLKAQHMHRFDYTLNNFSWTPTFAVGSNTTDTVVTPNTTYRNSITFQINFGAFAYTAFSATLYGFVDSTTQGKVIAHRARVSGDGSNPNSQAIILTDSLMGFNKYMIVLDGGAISGAILGNIYKTIR